jgi:hypothetical protein
MNVRKGISYLPVFKGVDGIFVTLSARVQACVFRCIQVFKW